MKTLLKKKKAETDLLTKEVSDNLQDLIEKNNSLRAEYEKVLERQDEARLALTSYMKLLKDEETAIPARIKVKNSADIRKKKSIMPIFVFSSEIYNRNMQI